MPRIALIAAALLAVPALAQGQVKYEFKSMTVGDPAPALDVDHWLKGSPVTEFEKGDVYVVEFWATWCAPCRANVPHLAKLQDQYKDYDVTFVGLSDEELPIVVEFMSKADSEGKSWFRKMGYTVASDPDRSVYIDYMTSSGKNTIPTAFIVGKDGRVEWIGNPAEIDEPLEAVVKDTWDRAAFAAEWEEKMADKRSRLAPRYRYEKARSVADWSTALEAVDELIAADPSSSTYKINRFLLLVRDLDRPEEGYDYGKQVANEHWGDYKTLNSLAWYTLDKRGIRTRNLKFALKFAMRAAELTEYENASVLDTLARAYYERGDLDNAILYQQMAVDKAAEASKHELNEVLLEYREAAGK